MTCTSPSCNLLKYTHTNFAKMLYFTLGILEDVALAGLKMLKYETSCNLESLKSCFLSKIQNKSTR